MNMNQKVATEKKKNVHKKYLITFIVVTFGLCWGICLLYVLFYDRLVPVFGELELTNPLVILALNAPSVIGLIIYFWYDGLRGLGGYLKTLIPRKKDLIWFPIIIVVMVLYVVAVRLICMLVGVAVPEMTLGPANTLMVFLRNFYEEIGMLGTAFGYYGFVLPYLQKRFNSNIKAGMLTGFILGMFVAPGYIFSSFETATNFPFYVAQMMILSVCISYVLNATRGNVLFFLMMFWIASTGSKVQLYYFIPSVQIIQIALFAVLWVVLHYVFKSKNENTRLETKLTMFPEFIKA